MRGLFFYLFFAVIISSTGSYALGIGIVPDKIEARLQQNSCADYYIFINNPSEESVHYSFEKNDWFFIPSTDGKLEPKESRKIIAKVCAKNKLPADYETILLIKAGREGGEEGNVNAGIGIKTRIKVEGKKKPAQKNSTNNKASTNSSSNKNYKPASKEAQMTRMSLNKPEVLVVAVLLVILASGVLVLFLKKGNKPKKRKWTKKT